MMIKQFSADDWDFGIQPVELVKFSSKGLVGKDFDVLAKRASPEIAWRIKQLEIPEGCEPAHIIAMGSTDFFGPNRNGDGFKHATLRRRHDTFERCAQAYRHHQNKDPKKRYGEVKCSFFNEPTSRVELLGLYYGTEKAAQERDGLVADKELSTLHAGKPLPVSMACKVSHDVCNFCGNKAANRSEYCDSRDNGGSCTMFGCKNGLTKVAANGAIQHVDNPDPEFFDISSVLRGADRTAFALPADYLQAS